MTKQLIFHWDDTMPSFPRLDVYINHIIKTGVLISTIVPTKYYQFSDKISLISAAIIIINDKPKT
jgi:hypothetical protein